MKSLKNTIFEKVIFFGVCAIALILYRQGLLPNISEGVAKAIPSISLILGVGLIFVKFRFRVININ